MRAHDAPQQAEAACSFEDFTDLIHRLLNATWGPDWGTFTEAFPNGRDPKMVELPVITYTLKEMVPGVVGNRDTRELKPRQRHQFSFPDGKTGTTVYGQMLDCEVLFEVWEENNTKAVERANQFRALLFAYTGFFKSQGVKELFFRKFSNENEGGEFRDNIIGRSLYYQLRLEELTELNYDTIQRISATVSAVRSLEAETDDGETERPTQGTISFHIDE